MLRSPVLIPALNLRQVQKVDFSMHGMDKRVAVENSPGDARALLLSSTQYGKPLAGGAKQLASLPRPVKIKGSAAAHEMS